MCTSRSGEQKSIETLFVLIMAIKPKCSSTDEQTPNNWIKDQFVKSNVNEKQTVRKCYIQCIFFHLSMKSTWLSVLLSNVYPEGNMSRLPLFLLEPWAQCLWRWPVSDRWLARCFHECWCHEYSLRKACSMHSSVLRRYSKGNTIYCEMIDKCYIGICN